MSSSSTPQSGPASAAEIRRLRKKTGAGIMACQQALQESKGDFERAEAWLRKKDLSQAAKKAGRKAAEGSVVSYVHPGGRLGVLLEVNSETDFAARGPEFQNFARDLSRHIAAMQPLFVSEGGIPPAVLEKEQKIFEEQAAERARRPELIPVIAKGLRKKWLEEVCLMDQEFVRESAEGESKLNGPGQGQSRQGQNGKKKPQKQTVSQALNELMAKIGENIVIRRFSRFALGEVSGEEAPRAASGEGRAEILS